MQQHSLKPIIISAFTEIEERLELYGHSDLFQHEELIENFLKSFVFDKQNESIWCWNIEEYIDNALENKYITEQQREDFLLEYLLGVTI